MIHAYWLPLPKTELKGRQGFYSSEVGSFQIGNLVGGKKGIVMGEEHKHDLLKNKKKMVAS